MSEHAAPSPKAEIFDSKSATGIARLLGLSAVAGLVILGICAFVNLKQFAFSWLFAVVYFFMLCVGGLFWVLLHHAVDAEWSVVVRRQLENLAGLLKYLAILFIPVLLLGPVLYASWWDVDPATDSLLATKSAYLNVPFFIILYDCLFRDSRRIGVPRAEVLNEAGQRRESCTYTEAAQDRDGWLDPLRFLRGVRRIRLAYELGIHLVLHDVGGLFIRGGGRFFDVLVGANRNGASRFWLFQAHDHKGTLLHNGEVDARLHDILGLHRVFAIYAHLVCEPA